MESIIKAKNRKVDAGEAIVKKINASPDYIDGIYRSWKSHNDSSESNLVRIADPIRIIADGRNDEGSGWGTLLVWNDLEGVEHQAFVPHVDLAHVSPGKALGPLVDGGCFISANRTDQSMLCNYLRTAERETDGLFLNVQKIGWNNNQFILPETAFGNDHQTFANYCGPRITGYGSAGDLSAWQTQIGKLASGNSRLLFSISAAFAGPLLELAQQESGGFHLLCQTSQGKTSILAAAASVFGKPSGYCDQWASTLNALEGLCLARNDGLLILDEMGQASLKDMGAAAYRIANGRAKARQQKDGGNRPTDTWRVLMLSAGEVDLEQQVMAAGERIHGGQMARLPSIPADAGKNMGLVEDIHDFANSAAFVDHIKRAAATNFGLAGQAFLTKLTEPDNLDEIRLAIDSHLAEMLADYEIPATAAPECRRVATRFCLVGYAGEIATSWGITGWEPSEAHEAAKRCFNDWLNASNAMQSHDDRTVLRQVRQMLEAHMTSRFPSSNLKPEQLATFRDLLGYTKLVDNCVAELWALPQQFKELILKGIPNKKTAINLLIAKGWIIPESENHQTRKRTLPGFEKSTRVYVLSSRAVNDEI